MSPAQKHVVAIGLSAAIVSVAEERPCVLVVKHPDDNGDALPFGPVRSAAASHFGNRPAHLGCRTNLSRSRLCRTALHLRRSRTSRAQAGRRPARGVGRISRADAQSGALKPPTRCGATGIAISLGKIGATRSPLSSPRRLRRHCAPSPKPHPMRGAPRCAASEPGSVSDSTAWLGRREGARTLRAAL